MTTDWQRIISEGVAAFRRQAEIHYGQPTAMGKEFAEVRKMLTRWLAEIPVDWSDLVDQITEFLAWMDEQDARIEDKNQ